MRLLMREGGAAEEPYQRRVVGLPPYFGVPSGRAGDRAGQDCRTEHLAFGEAVRLIACERQASQEFGKPRGHFLPRQ